MVGYSLGEWPDEAERAAGLAVNGDDVETRELLVKRRRKDARMNTEVRDPQKPAESAMLIWFRGASGISADPAGPTPGAPGRGRVPLSCCPDASIPA